MKNLGGHFVEECEKVEVGVVDHGVAGADNGVQ